MCIALITEKTRVAIDRMVRNWELLVLLPATLVIVAGFSYFVVEYWDWLRSVESGSTTVRNLGLVYAALIALPLAIWRSSIGHRQASAAQKQSETAYESLLNERYQKGSEMLGSPECPVRLGGIFSLERLADSHTEEFHIQIMRLFSAFVRNPPADENLATTSVDTLRQDVQTIMALVGKRSAERRELETRERYVFEAIGADLSGVAIFNGNLSNMDFSSTCLANSLLAGTDLSDTILYGADLSGANLNNVRLRGVFMSGTILSGAKLGNSDDIVGLHKPPRDLRQSYLDMAVADSTNPPDLTDATDCETGEPLVWHG